MDYKPSDFFIGVIDFFSVLLPGALLTFFLKGLLYRRLFGEGMVFPALNNEAQKAIAFLLATYVVGNLIFLMGSLLLDNLVYDKFLRNTFFRKNFDLAYLAATSIREQHLASETAIDQIVAAKKLTAADETKLLAKDRREVVNTFKWAQDYLAVRYPATLTDLQKQVADSKFFRSLVVAFLIISGVLLFKGNWIWAASFFVLSFLSAYRYGELRYKSTEKAYELIITVNHLDKPPAAENIQLQDNRARFAASAEAVRAYQARTAALVKGMRFSVELLEIPRTETWRVHDAQFAEVLFCLRGSSLLISRVESVEEKTSLSPGALVPLSPRSSFELTNSGQESLLILALK